MKAIGIDLGTTNSVACHITAQGTIEVIPSREGGRTTPSVFAITEDGARLVGRAAVMQEGVNACATVRSIKRKMGTSDRLTLQGQELSPEEISCEILRKIKSDAELYLGVAVDAAVITVPAYFDDSQRTATKLAGELAGLNVLRVINEPTAAALAYGLNQKKNEKVLVYDLGGGTFDVTVLEITDDDVFEVKSTAGDTRLGGDDFDNKIIDRILKSLESDYRVARPHCLLTAIYDPRPSLYLDEEQWSRLREAAEQAKVELSAANKTTVNIPYLAFFEKPVHVKCEITRQEFEEDICVLLDRARNCVMQALKDAKMDPENIDQVVFVGGSTRVPLVGEKVQEWTGKRPNRSINPDEAVAIGAAVQAGIMSGERPEDILLLDVIPLSLGIETLGGVMTAMISRNTTIPCEFTDEFTTAEDNQTEVEVRVYQGERPQAKDNKMLGTFKLVDLIPAPRGTLKINVVFSVDADGILSVSAVDKATGKEQTVVITGSSSLTSEDVQRMIAEAEANKDADDKFRLLSTFWEQIENYILQADTLLRKQREYLSAEVIDDLEDLKASLDGARRSEHVELLENLIRVADDPIQRASKELEAKAEALIEEANQKEAE